ncbi:MAG: hypothetical protein ACREID_03215, partial [Planctomycetota bacterium]
IKETDQLVDREFRFHQAPREWDAKKVLPMSIQFREEGGAHFVGRFDYQGQERNGATVIDRCALRYNMDAKVGMRGANFQEVTVEGTCRRESGSSAEIGVAVGNPDAKAGVGLKGVWARLHHRQGCLAVKLDGGKSDLFKATRGLEYSPFDKVPWPQDGKFTIEIRVLDRQKGTFELLFNGANVFQAQLGQATETCSAFGSGGAGRNLALAIWVEGNDGDDFKDIYLHKVTLTLSKAK